ncbi:MAG: hypothetical protein WBN42_00465 [Ignavibacteriaceae bacterium]
MAESISFAIPGSIGNIAGPEADGVLVGQLTATALTKGLLKTTSGTALATQDDGNTYTDYATEFGEATADDVPVLPTVPAVDDAFYYGLAGTKFASVEQNITTQGVGTWTIVWEYWNGTAYTALAGVTDGTTGFTAATGWVSTDWTVPVDWAQNTVDGVNAYWVRARVSAYTAVTTPPLVGQGYVVASAATWTDATTDINDAGAGDVELMSLNPVVGDGLYVVHTEKFCALKLTYSQAAVGTFTITPKYWNGTAYVAITTYDDDTAGYITAAGTEYIHFVPPANWAANTAANGPDGNAGYTIVLEVTAFTSMTTQPLGTQAWVLPLKTGADGIAVPNGGSISTVQMQAQTKSGTAADSTFLLVNVSNGTADDFTWTKGDPTDSDTVSLTVSAGNKLAIVQITEDGTTEFADCTILAKL